MKRQDLRNMKSIEINLKQLNSLLNDKEKEDYDFLLKEGTYCHKCNTHKTGGVNTTQIILNALNDIQVHGTCVVCSSKVCRIMEFGEDKNFSERANLFRNTLSN